MNVKLVGISYPHGIEGIETAEDFIAYAAKVSNPTNQLGSGDKLIRYLIKHKHWSPFEMVSVTMEIETTRDIGRQILRHRSFSFQEFSQRYAEVIGDFEYREARLQDPKNRQNSIKTDNETLEKEWLRKQEYVAAVSADAYEWALKAGIAKEQARAVLPEGLTSTRMYMSGTLRSWIHYCDLRCENGTQLEHMEVARAALDVLETHFPNVAKALADARNS